MPDLSIILSSPARIKVLQTLFRSEQGFALRHIAYLTNTPVFSIQRAVTQLFKEKIILKKRSGKFLFYSLNKNHPAYKLIIEIFRLESKSRLQKRCGQYNQKAKSWIKFCESSLELIQQGRRKSKR